MKCGEPKPGSSYQECDEELLHPGDHSYLGQTWPRLVVPEMDPEIAALIEQAAGRNAWDLTERSYPLIVEETITRLVWVDAESEEAALDQIADEPWEYKGGDPIGSSAEARRPDEFERRDALSQHTGPEIACPGCGALAYSRAWFHSPYRRCHGPIVWEQHSPTSRPHRSWQRTPAYTNGGAA